MRSQGESGFLGMQVHRGTSLAMSGNVTVSGTRIYDNSGGTVPLDIFFQPSVDAWWEVSFHLGYLLKVDANYHYTQLFLGLSPADEGGNTGSGTCLESQHNSVQTYAYKTVTAFFPLRAGTLYRCWPGFSLNGGTWQYYCGPDHLWIAGKGWVR